MNTSIDTQPPIDIQPCRQQSDIEALLTPYPLSPADRRAIVAGSLALLNATGLHPPCGE